MGGRIKTLHPVRSTAALLGRRGEPTITVMEEHGIDPIDLVVVNLYPFEGNHQPARTCSHGRRHREHRHRRSGHAPGGSQRTTSARVAVVVDPGRLPGGALDARSRAACRFEYRSAKPPGGQRRIRHTSQPTTPRSAAYLARQYLPEDGPFPQRPAFCPCTSGRVSPLRYGENPASERRLSIAIRTRSEPALVVSRARQRAGQAPVLQQHRRQPIRGAGMRSSQFYEPACVIVKHANPCGVAVDRNRYWRPTSGRSKTDPTSAFGGIIALNQSRPGPDETARAIIVSRQFVEVIVAPDLQPTAHSREILGARNRTSGS